MTSSPAPAAEPRDEALWQRALALRRSAIVVDGHNDITGALTDDGYDLAKPSAGKHHTDLPRLREKWRDDRARSRAERRKLMEEKLPVTPLSVVIDHIEHIIKVAGVDHVGLGSDFDGISIVPADLRDVSMFPNVAYELLKRGHSEADVRKILGENFLRVFAEVERRATVKPDQVSGGR